MKTRNKKPNGQAEQEEYFMNDQMNKMPELTLTPTGVEVPELTLDAMSAVKEETAMQERENKAVKLDEAILT